jgi:hypothetical protein
MEERRQGINLTRHVRQAEKKFGAPENAQERREAEAINRVQVKGDVPRSLILCTLPPPTSDPTEISYISFGVDYC